MKKIGFDNKKYLELQRAAILRRFKGFGNKLYLEFGGKLCSDYHAQRVLPGYDPNIKLELLQSLKDKIEIILCIYAFDIERGRVRGDFGITYDAASLKLIDDLRKRGLDVSAIVITRFNKGPRVEQFEDKLIKHGIKVYLHKIIKGYPVNLDLVLSENGFGKNEYIPTHKPIVVVTGPGPGSGKLATCFSQIYHDYKRGVNSGYAKFETFPVWNLPLKHPVNLAYEAATADILDFNLVDPYHLTAYNKKVVNYNRDVESFPILKEILAKITREKSAFLYKSPTDMGINYTAFAITDDSVVREAAKQEIIRRYFRHNVEFAKGIGKKKTVNKTKSLMKELNLKPEDRAVVKPARDAAREAEKKGNGHKDVFCGAAVQLKNGQIVSGKNSPFLHASSSLVLNAIKTLANIPDKILLLSVDVIKRIGNLKRDILGFKAESLDLEETLISLSASALPGSPAQIAVKKLRDLRGCEAHVSHIPTPGDEAGFRRLGVNLTADANFSSSELFTSV